MNGNLLEDNTKGLLLLILPLAVAIIFVYQFWYIILGLFILIIIAQIWQNYQWKQWTFQVNPFFNELIIENQGCLTPLDLSVKANLTAKAAQNFLEKKAEEYGAQKKFYDDKGVIYYFLTANALQSIFEDSEPLSLAATLTEEKAETDLKTVTNIGDLFEEDQIIETDENEEDEEYLEDEDLEEDQELGILSLASALDEIEETTHHEMTIQEMAKLVEVTEDSPLPLELQEDNAGENSVKKIAELIELDQTENVTQTTTKTINYQSLRLKQNELAKRLDIHYNTIGKRKSDSDFPQWTQRRDPDNIAWEYLPKIKLFAPIEIKNN